MIVIRDKQQNILNYKAFDKMIKNKLTGLLLLATIIFFAVGCTKTASNLTIPPSLAKFMGEAEQDYAVDVDPAPPFIVRVGVTGAADEDRTVTVNVSSTTGAVAGTHYTVSGLGAGNTITIPAGEVFAEFSIIGNFNEYVSGRRDTLQIKLDEPGMDVASYNDVLRVAMRGPCFDGNITEADLEAMVGVYNNSFDAGFDSWGPYPTRVVSITPLTATTARAIINNVFDYGLGDVPFIIDWSDPSNVVINVETPTVTGGDAGIINSAYAGANLIIRAPAVATTAANNFSICNNRINLRYQLGVYENGVVLGYFGTVATTQMRR
ncbi:MAG: hypothetical protein NVV59_12535 [Chitinophagaceae bacterium]|nr:hypothetical protein [Chitinophagaceae bacterium]